jgi:hypothetical protein
MLTTFAEKRSISMRNSFESNLDTLLAETISDSFVRLRKHNTDYAKMIFKGLALNY